MNRYRRLKIKETVASRTTSSIDCNKKMENVELRDGNGTSTGLLKLVGSKLIKYKDVRFPDGSFTFVKDSLG